MTQPLPPNSPEAEETLLGALMLAPEAVKRVIDILEPDGEAKFFRPSHGLIYKAAKSLYQEGRPAEPSILVERLGPQLENAGGRHRIGELASLVPAWQNVGHYAQIVKDSWARRLVLQRIAAVEQQVRDGGKVVDALTSLDTASMEVRGLVEEGKKHVIHAPSLADYLREKVAHPTDDDQGIATPFRKLGRMQPSRLYVLSGYMKDGKTAISVQFLKAAADVGGFIGGTERRPARVGFASMEMSWEDLTDRVAASFGVPYWQAQTGRVEPQYQSAMDRATTQMDGWKVDVIDDPALSVPKLVGYQRAGGYDLLIIDHLHLFGFDDRRGIEQVVLGITNLARRSEIPILLLAQLRRSSDPKKPFPVPTMAQLRETAMIEANASAVWFVWRKRDEEHLTTNEARFIVAANRFGPPHAFDLEFIPDEVRFSDAGV